MIRSQNYLIFVKNHIKLLCGVARHPGYFFVLIQKTNQKRAPEITTSVEVIILFGFQTDSEYFEKQEAQNYLQL
jgi:hypothetical protein